VVQISPPLVAGPEEFDRIASILGDVLSEAWDEYAGGRRRERPPSPAGPEAPAAGRER
jgi:hypothetical protein